MDKRDFMRKMLQKEEEAEEESLMSKEEICAHQNHGPLPEMEGTFPHNQYPQVCPRSSLLCAGLALELCPPNCFDCVLFNVWFNMNTYDV